MTETSKSLYDRARELEDEAAALRRKASDLHKAELSETPLLERLCFAAYARCACGLGLAYDPAGVVTGLPESPFRKPHAWECSGVLLGTADKDTVHEAFAFAFYEIKSEKQPSAGGLTTRPTAH